MIVYCNQKICIWNENGQCNAGPKQPAYITETLGGQVICSDMKYKEGWEDEEE